MRGAISLSSSSHFALKLYSNSMKPVALPPGRAKLLTKPAPTGSANEREHDRHGASDLLDCRHAQGARGKHDVRRQCDQLRCVFASRVGVACIPAIVNPYVAAD